MRARKKHRFAEMGLFLLCFFLSFRHMDASQQTTNSGKRRPSTPRRRNHFLSLSSFQFFWILPSHRFPEKRWKRPDDTASLYSIYRLRPSINSLWEECKQWIKRASFESDFDWHHVERSDFRTIWISRANSVINKQLQHNSRIVSIIIRRIDLEWKGRKVMRVGCSAKIYCDGLSNRSA